MYLQKFQNSANIREGKSWMSKEYTEREGVGNPRTSLTIVEEAQSALETALQDFASGDWFTH